MKSIQNYKEALDMIYLIQDQLYRLHEYLENKPGYRYANLLISSARDAADNLEIELVENQ